MRVLCNTNTYGLLTLLSAAMLLIGSLSPAYAGEDVSPGKQVANEFEVEIEDESVTVRYWLFVPESYTDDSEMPLMLFLHGAGERGDDLDVVKKWGPPKLAEADSEFPFVVVSPQCPSNERWNPRALALLVDHLAGELAVDNTRMYVTGLSMGGYGTWALLAENPKLFAAAVPICGGGDPSKAERYAHVPIWVFHGDADRVVPAEQSRQMVEALKEADGNVKYTEYEGVGHNSWSEAYGTQEVYEWLLKQRRSQ